MWHDGILYSSRGPRQNCGRADGLLDRREAGEQAPRDAKLPTPAELNMIAQKYFEQQGSGNKGNWDLAFENGYEEGFKKTHRQ